MPKSNAIKRKSINNANRKTENKATQSLYTREKQMKNKDITILVQPIQPIQPIQPAKSIQGNYPSVMYEGNFPAKSISNHHTYHQITSSHLTAHQY
jgi:hypothetical protein